MCAVVCVCICRGGQRGVPIEQQVVIETKQGLIRERLAAHDPNTVAVEPKQEGPGNKVVII